MEESPIASVGEVFADSVKLPPSPPSLGFGLIGSKININCMIDCMLFRKS